MMICEGKGWEGEGFSSGPGALGIIWICTSGEETH